VVSGAREHSLSRRSPGAGVFGNLDRAADDEVRRLEME
jgi:hypothetical protein